MTTPKHSNMAFATQLGIPFVGLIETLLMIHHLLKRSRWTLETYGGLHQFGLLNHQVWTRFRNRNWLSIRNFKILEIFIHFKIQIHCIGTVQPRVAVQSVPFVGPMMHCQLQWSLSVNTTPTLSVPDDLKVRSLVRNSAASNVRPIMSTWHHWLIISSLVLLVPALFKMLTFMTAMPCWANTMVLFYLVTSIGRKWRTHSKVHRLNFEFWFFLVIFVVNSAVDLKCNKRGPKWPIFDLFLF